MLAAVDPKERSYASWMARLQDKPLEWLHMQTSKHVRSHNGAAYDEAIDATIHARMVAGALQRRPTLIVRDDDCDPNVIVPKIATGTVATVRVPRDLCCD